MSPADYGYEDAYKYMHICATCFQLYETGRPDGMEQTCTCRRAGQARWPVFDFNERASLCQCCGFNVLSSGSRWSSYFCRECKLLAMGVSVWNRRLIIPVGRHSLMHTWVPDTPPMSLNGSEDRPEDLATGVHQSLGGIVRGTEVLSRWYVIMMARNLKHFGFQGDVSLREYLAAVAVEGPALMARVKAFEGLCALFQSDPK